MSTISSGSSRLTASPTVSDLRSMPGPARGRHPEGAAEGRAERRADAGDLVFGLEGAHAELLVLGELVQDVRRRRDRVASQGTGAAWPDGRPRVAPRQVPTLPVTFV